jgi:hypothetical protein
MTTTQAVLWIMGFIGAILACVALYQIITCKGKIKRNTWALFATGEMLVTPSATINLLTESGMLWKIIFAAVLLSGLIAVFNLTSNTKEK